MKTYLTIKAICPKNGNKATPGKCVNCKHNINIIETERYEFIICKLTTRRKQPPRKIKAFCVQCGKETSMRYRGLVEWEDEPIYDYSCEECGKAGIEIKRSDVIQPLTSIKEITFKKLHGISRK